MILIWTAMAEADLDSIVARPGRQSEEALREMVARIALCAERLESFPLSGPIVAEDKTNSLREVYEAPYRIIYRIIEESDEVHILGVVHSARRFPRHLLPTN